MRETTEIRRVTVASESLRAPGLGVWLRAVPTAFLVACAWALAWYTGGSIDGPDWLPYAAGCGLALAAILLSGAATTPSRSALVPAGLLLGFAAWTAISLDWSPARSDARDAAFLAALYVVAYAIPLVTLRRDEERLVGTALVVCGLGSLAVAAALKLRFVSHPENLYEHGRLAFPVTYTNGVAGMMLVGFWPAAGLTSDRRLPSLVRAGAMAAAVAMVAYLVMAQSKGGAIALVLSGIVFLAVCPFRLRALVPLAIIAAIVGVEVPTLTRPYRVNGDELSKVTSAIDHAVATAAVLTGIGAAVGLAYAVLERRVRVPERVCRVATVALLVMAVATPVGGVAAFFARVDRPGHFFAERWHHFKHLPKRRMHSSHFLTLGSNRYDFWRVALDEFEDHPVAGIGARGFEADYLIHRRSPETPARSHSIELDALGETGIVGFLLLIGAGAFGFMSLWRGARMSLVGAGVLGAGVYFAAHTAVDWNWTIPAVSLPAFTLFGIGASVASGGLMRVRAAVPAGLAALALAIVGFAPPWLSARFVDRAYEADTASAVRNDLRWARRLDPLSTDPLLAEAELARPPADIPPLERAVAKEPRQEELRYLLGTAYLRAGRKAAARRELREALRLFPDDDLAKAALEKAR